MNTHVTIPRGVARLRLARDLGFIVLTAASCGGEAAGPNAPNEKGARLSAASPTQIKGTVVTAVIDAPSVAVHDASGKALAGVVVTFSVRTGAGAIETPRVVSSSAGIASVGRWTLGTVRGTNVLVATIASGDSVVFTGDAVAGPPFFIEKVGGDGQITSPGAALAIHPQVSVSDLYHNGLSGVTVTFAVEAGGGSVSRAVAVTDSAGSADSGDWVLGETGLQRMVARAGALVSEFTARAGFPLSCAPPAVLPIQTMVQSQLTPLSCTGADGRFLRRVFDRCDPARRVPLHGDVRGVRYAPRPTRG